MISRAASGFLIVLLFAAAVAAQKGTAFRAGTNPKTELIAALQKLRKTSKIRITASGKVNDTLTENFVLEYLPPDKYHWIMKKVQDGKTVESEIIQIDGKTFEKDGAGQWATEKKASISLKKERKMMVDMFSNPKTKDNVDVEFAGEEQLSGKTFFVYKFVSKNKRFFNKGVVWVSSADGLPGKMEIETTYGSNRISGSTVYDYSEIVIEKPVITAK